MIKPEHTQIEEIARIICKSGSNKGVCEGCGFNKRCWKFVDAEAIYNAGYRKQSEETPPPVVIKRYDKWISIDTMLPEDVFGKHRKQMFVLVHTKSGRVGMASRVRTVSWEKSKNEYTETDSFEWNGNKKVTHWMPLPEAPKGE